MTIFSYMSEKTKVLFVCLGNICRSPTAHGIFEKLVADAGLTDKFEIDSAGTSALHQGEQPDPRSQLHAFNRGYVLEHQRSRRVDFADLMHYDYILAMDNRNHDDLMNMAPKDLQHKIHLMLEYADEDLLVKRNRGSKEVPDPYYKSEGGFELVLDLLEDACERLLNKLSN